PRDLHLLLIADDDRLVPSRPDLISPPMEAADLPRDVGAHVPHESGELEGVVDVEQEMEVVRREGVTTAADFVETLGSAEDAHDDLVERPAGPKEEAALEGPAGDLDQGAAVGDEAKLSAHAPIRRKMTPKTCSP